MVSARFPDLEGASVLITGGGSGIGAALTEGFARQGCKVAFIDIADAPSMALTERVEAATGSRPLYLNADLRDIERLRAAVAEAAPHGGPQHSLIAHLGDVGFWFESFQNWQSEFLATAALVVLSIVLRFRGSPESKYVNASNAKTGR